MYCIDTESYEKKASLFALRGESNSHLRHGTVGLHIFGQKVARFGAPKNRNLLG